MSLEPLITSCQRLRRAALTAQRTFGVAGHYPRVSHIGVIETCHRDLKGGGLHQPIINELVERHHTRSGARMRILREKTVRGTPKFQKPERLPGTYELGRIPRCSPDCQVLATCAAAAGDGQQLVSTITIKVTQEEPVAARPRCRFGNHLLLSPARRYHTDIDLIPHWIAKTLCPSIFLDRPSLEKQPHTVAGCQLAILLIALIPGADPIT